MMLVLSFESPLVLFLAPFRLPETLNNPKQRVDFTTNDVKVY